MEVGQGENKVKSKTPDPFDVAKDWGGKNAYMAALDQFYFNLEAANPTKFKDIHKFFKNASSFITAGDLVP